VVHSDAAGAETWRGSLSDWLTDMSLVGVSRMGEVDDYIGYREPYATSHQALDRDAAFMEDTRNAARALAEAIKLSRAGQYRRPDEKTGRSESEIKRRLHLAVRRYEPASKRCPPPNTSNEVGTASIRLSMRISLTVLTPASYPCRVRMASPGERWTFDQSKIADEPR
jgi:hypothetical protein